MKMGAQRPVTFGPDEMGRLRDIVPAGRFSYADGGSYRFVGEFPGALYCRSDQPAENQAQAESRRGLRQWHGRCFAPQVLEALGCEVVPLDTELDFNFPRYNPNPEDMKMLHAMADKVRESARMSVWF